MKQGPRTRDQGTGPEEIRQGPDPFEEPVVLPIEDELDLHPFSPKEVRSVVGEYLEQASQRGFQEVRIIHGRGRGVQRWIVRSLLAHHPLVLSFADAAPEEGGWGATLVHLKGPEQT